MEPESLECDGAGPLAYKLVATMMRGALVLLGMVVLATEVFGQDVRAELYGAFRYSYNYVDPGDGAHWASANNASRLGVSGEVTGQGLAAFLDLQTGVAVDTEDTSDVFTLRHFFAGVRGGFGALTWVDTRLHTRWPVCPRTRSTIPRH